MIFSDMKQIQIKIKSSLVFYVDTMAYILYIFICQPYRLREWNGSLIHLKQSEELFCQPWMRC